jgi:hypothetical protein
MGTSPRKPVLAFVATLGASCAQSQALTPDDQATLGALIGYTGGHSEHGTDE